MRQDAAAALISMGYSLLDFVADDRGSGTEITWLSARPMPSEATINAYDLPAGQLAAVYTKAKALLTSDDPVSKTEKATLLVVLDEFNAHATKFNALFAAIAAATSLANLQQRVAALGNYPTRTIAQMKAGISGKIDSGNADG